MTTSFVGEYIHDRNLVDEILKHNPYNWGWEGEHLFYQFIKHKDDTYVVTTIQDDKPLTKEDMDKYVPQGSTIFTKPFHEDQLPVFFYVKKLRG